MPVIGETYAFGHIPKNAGSTVQEWVRVHDGGKPIDQHGPLTADRVGHRQAFVTLRDPWSWYASFWAHACACGKERGERRRVYGETFDEFLMNATSLNCHPEDAGVIFDGLRVRRCLGGLWTQIARRTVGETSPLVLDATRIYPAMLELTGWNLKIAHQNRRESRPYNPLVPTSPYREWYTPEMIDAVAKYDGELIAALGARPFDGLAELVQPWPKTREPVEDEMTKVHDDRIAELEAEIEGLEKIKQACIDEIKRLQDQVVLANTNIHRNSGALIEVKRMRDKIVVAASTSSRDNPAPVEAEA